ncbi:hypothetical protein FisN_4Hh359 [Fistulifera solaris]|uniref:START domain-containing protein n=1 Tax=Fistulifera solaris TaxID=1519565 RepID=A0A1Z5KQ62_FISSO|nr:hypothetical protein FisN_4Hh359 [Fistulifera solaris]|eukprot:GAX28450.1 hypothetical protein FisN_4Hh359 [Fistulifera solaris]
MKNTDSEAKVASEKDDARSDAEILAQAEQYLKEDRLNDALLEFRKVKDTSLFTAMHNEGVRKGIYIEEVYKKLESPASEGWTKQGESHGHRDFITYYKVESGGKLWCRIESVIEASLYVPLLAVLNETDLYETWFPKWSFPHLGIQQSKKIKQAGRVEQLVQLTVDLPFPLNKREIMFWGFADDDSASERRVGAKLLNVDESFEYHDIPAADKGVTRMDFVADFLFRQCPEDHPALAKSKQEYPEGEKKILVTFVLFCDPKIGWVPHFFQNFCTRIAIGTVWKMLLGIAEDVREGKRKEHADLIMSKREELYDWVEERAEAITGVQKTLSKNDLSLQS